MDSSPGLNPDIYSRGFMNSIKSNQSFNHQLGWGPVSNYKPGGGGVSYINEYLGRNKNNSIEENGPPSIFNKQNEEFLDSLNF